MNVYYRHTDRNKHKFQKQKRKNDIIIKGGLF